MVKICPTAPEPQCRERHGSGIHISQSYDSDMNNHRKSTLQKESVELICDRKSRYVTHYLILLVTLFNCINKAGTMHIMSSNKENYINSLFQNPNRTHRYDHMIQVLTFYVARPTEGDVHINRSDIVA